MASPPGLRAPPAHGRRPARRAAAAGWGPGARRTQRGRSGRPGAVATVPRALPGLSPPRHAAQRLAHWALRLRVLGGCWWPTRQAGPHGTPCCPCSAPLIRAPPQPATPAAHAQHTGAPMPRPGGRPARRLPRHAACKHAPAGAHPARGRVARAPHLHPSSSLGATHPTPNSVPGVPSCHLLFCMPNRRPAAPPARARAVAYVRYDRASSAALAMESLNGAVLNRGRGPKLKVLLAEAPSARSVVHEAHSHRPALSATDRQCCIVLGNCFDAACRLCASAVLLPLLAHSSASGSPAPPASQPPCTHPRPPPRQQLLVPLMCRPRPLTPPPHPSAMTPLCARAAGACNRGCSSSSWRLSWLPTRTTCRPAPACSSWCPNRRMSS